MNQSTKGVAEEEESVDFGISTEDGGAVLNEGLVCFKEEFGGGGVVHEVFTLDL